MSSSAASSGSDHQSESMGRSGSSDDSEEEEEITVPMKGPSISLSASNTVLKNESSFLDEDFLSFGHVDNGGNAADEIDDSKPTKKKMACRKRERPHHDINDNYNHSNGSALSSDGTTNSIPWLDNNNTVQQYQNNHHQQYSHIGRNNNRGYNNNHHHPNNNNNYYTPPTPPLIQLHNEIVSFMKLMSPTPHEEQIRSMMVQRITNLAQTVFGKEECEVLPFGSQVTGLALPGSDIDFVIRFPKKDKKKKSDDDELEEEEEELTSSPSSDPLQKIAEAVKTEFGIKSEFEMDTTTSDSNNNTNNTNDSNQESEKEEHLSYLEVITQTRVPLVKFTIAPYNLDIDICFDQPHGPESADLMHRFMESMPPLRPLTVCLKYFLASREINKPFTGGIGSYLLQLMIVSFLQHRSRGDLNRGYGGSGQHFNLGSLLLDFLELYGLDFNYVTTGISVRHDGYYFPKGQLDKKEYFWQPNRPTSIAVQNPLDPTMDVGAGAYRIQMISRVFDHAFKTLLAYVSEPMMGEVSDSILAKILPPTEEMANRRVLKDALEGRNSGDGVVSKETTAAATSSSSSGNSVSRGSGSDKQRGTSKPRQKEKRNHSKNWDKNKDNKKRRNSSSGGSDHGSGGKFKNSNKKKRYSK